MSKKIGLGLVVVLLMAIGVFAGSYLSNETKLMTALADTFLRREEEEIFYEELEPFLVNLKNEQNQPQEYLSIGLSIGVNGEENKETLNAQIPKVRDSIISYLTGQTSEQLLEQEENELNIKEDLKKILNTNIFNEEDIIQEVLIIELLIQ